MENWWSDPLNLVKVVLFVSTPAYGKEVPAIIEQPLEEIHTHIGKNTVTYEARLLKALFYEVIGWNKWHHHTGATVTWEVCWSVKSPAADGEEMLFVSSWLESRDNQHMYTDTHTHTPQALILKSSWESFGRNRSHIIKPLMWSVWTVQCARSRFTSCYLQQVLCKLLRQLDNFM